VNTLNATSIGGGNFVKNVAALVLNVTLAGITNPIGGLYYNSPGDTLHGKTVSQILAAANQAVAGGALPSGYTFNSFSALINQINQGWNKCKPNALVNQGALVET